MTQDKIDAMTALLDELKISATKKGQILDLLQSQLTEMLPEEIGFQGHSIAVMHVIGGRAAVETVEAYGLEIGLDAAGNATRVGSVHGLEV